MESEALMSDYIWCHGPRCHERPTTNRVRGVKGSKVLRTIKINGGNYRDGLWNYFCDQTCLMNFMHKHWNEFIALHPRPEALETPIEDPVRKQNDYGWFHTEIKAVDNA